MLQKLVTYGTYGTLFCGVEHASINGIETIHGLVLKQQKKEFSIAAKFQVGAIAELENQLKAKQHLFISINTEKVLFKVLDGELEEQRALIQAFPNLKIEDFYYEFHMSNGKTFIAICRKDVIEKILKEYASNQFNVLGFSLGNLGVSQLESFIETTNIQTSNGKVHFANGAVSEISIANIELNNYTINGLQVNNVYVLSLAGILAYYTNSLAANTNFGDSVIQLKSNFKHKRIFDLGLKCGLGIIFISLLISFMLFSHYSSKVEIISSSLVVNKSQKTSLLKLADDVAKKEKLLNDFSLTSSRSSWHLDQLGQIIPNSIELTEMQWQPITKTIKATKQIETQTQTILIKGVANKASDFSQWVDKLEQKEWISTVSIHAYGNGKKRIPAFELALTFTQ